MSFPDGHFASSSGYILYAVMFTVDYFMVQSLLWLLAQFCEDAATVVEVTMLEWNAIAL